MSRLASGVVTFLSTVVLGWPSLSGAQMYRPEHAIVDGPLANLPLSRDAVEALNAELNEDLRALGAFGGGKRGIDRFPRHGEAASGWKVYGRFYLFNFKNEIEDEGGTSISWRKFGPKIGGARIYVGFHRQLD